MDLPVAWSLLLLAAAIWNFVIWPPFLRRIAKDGCARDADGRPTTFLQVHAILIGISLTLALAVGILGVLTLT